MKKYVLGPNAARKLKALLAKSDGVSRRPTGSSAFASDLEYAAPFTVKWAASANGGEGAWIIWLPGDGLLVLRGEKVDLSADLEEAGGDYPEGWYVIGDDVLSGDGGDLYLKISLADDESSEGDDSDDESVAEFVGEDDDDDSESLCIAVASCEVDAENGSRLIRQFVDSALVIGDMSTMIAGDSESSEWVKVSGRKLVIQGYPGSGEGADEVDNCGLVFTTVGPRVDDDGNKIPAKIYVGVKDKLSSECWAAKTMTVPLAGGGTKVVHFLGCDDVDLTDVPGGGGGGGDSDGCGCEGSDYVEVESQTETDDDGNETHKKVIKAKIATESDSAHALITNDTVQKIKAKKTFAAPVIVGDENGKHFKLDASQIPASCAGQIQIRELKVPGNDPQNSGTFHSSAARTSILQR